MLKSRHLTVINVKNALHISNSIQSIPCNDAHSFSSLLNSSNSHDQIAPLESEQPLLDSAFRSLPGVQVAAAAYGVPGGPGAATSSQQAALAAQGVSLSQQQQQQGVMMQAYPGLQQFQPTTIAL